MAITSHGEPGGDLAQLKRYQQALWEADRVDWRITQPFMADLADALRLVSVIDDSLPSAVTDGRAIFFNARFSAGLNDVARRFLQAHLVWHCVLGHILPRKVRGPHRWHLACDHEVNCLLVNQGIALPDRAVLFLAQFGMPANTLYDWLEGHPAPQLEQPLDLNPIGGITPVLSATRDDGYRTVQPDKTLIHNWQMHARLLARDYRETPHLPSAVATTLRGLELAC